MAGWLDRLRYNPVKEMLQPGNDAVSYFARRDLFEERVEPITHVWQLPEAQKILRRQRPDGSWKYPGKRTVTYPRHHYALLETFKQFRLLVERYELTREHPAGEKAAEFLFTCQTDDGDIRGMIGNQYATYYTGAIMAHLIKAGYGDDPRIERGFQWLLSMRQDDGGWTVPILTHGLDRETQHRLTSQHADSLEPVRSKPFSHNWTDMVLRAFAAHPRYRESEEARAAGTLLKSRFFKPDAYSSYRAASYWVRFAFWWPNLITSLDSLSKMGFPGDDPDMKTALDWFIEHQEPNGLWKVTYVKGKNPVDNERKRERRLWVSLAICRILKRLYG